MKKFIKQGEENPYTGLIKKFYTNIKIMSETNIQDGKLNLIFKVYYGNGEIAMEENYKNGKLIRILKN